MIKSCNLKNKKFKKFKQWLPRKMLNWPTKGVRVEQTTVISKDNRRGPIGKGNLNISYFLDILLIMLKYFCRFQPYQTKSNQFSTLITYSWCIRLSGIMQCYRSRASWAITQELEFWQKWNLGWEVKYYNHYRLSSAKSNDKIFKKVPNGFWGPFFLNTSKNKFL